jgi:Na+-driven multidrug efflux pump
MFNVIPLLASAINNSNYAGQLQSALGLSASTIKTFITIMMNFLLASVLMALFLGLYRGSAKADRGQLAKARNRLFSLVALPLIVVTASSLISQFTHMTLRTAGIGGSYQKYMVDDKNWAFRYNLAPNGADTSKDGGFSTTGSGPDNDGFVNTKYNPYTKAGKDRIALLNQGSTLIGNSTASGVGTGNFVNTSLALEYMTGDTFDSKAYIGYKTSKQSMDEKATGSIYKIVNSTVTPAQAKALLSDTSKNLRSSNLSASSYADADKYTQVSDANYGKAISDYSSDGKTLRSDVSTTTAWVERFIYGYKSSGEKVKDYYNAPVSVEQVIMNVGNDSSSGEGYGLSDESAYFALNTQFNETGGKYLLDAPARGIMSAKATFDSNRADYYTVSIVGVPVFTALGMLSDIMLQLIVLIATVLGIISLGLVEMNLKPLMAWVKGITKGDIEYAGAFMIYAVGIAGTILTITFVPQAMMTLLSGASNFVLTGLGSVATGGGAGANANAGLATGVLSNVVEFLVSGIVVLLFVKSPKFRNQMVTFIVLPWAWAREAGTKMERRAEGNVRPFESAGKMASNNKVSQAMDAWNDTHNGKLAQTAGAYATGRLSGLSKDEAKDRADSAGRRFERDKSAQFSKQLGEIFGYDGVDPDSKSSSGRFIDDEVRDELARDEETAQALKAFEAKPSQANADALNDSIDKFNGSNPDAKLRLPQKFQEELDNGTAVERMVDAKPRYKVDDVVDNKPIIEEGERKQLDDANFNARQALSDLRNKYPDIDDDMIEETNNALDEFEREPTEQNLDAVLNSLNKVHESITLDEDTENDFTDMTKNLEGTRDITQNFDKAVQDSVDGLNADTTPIETEAEIAKTTEGVANVSGVNKVDLTADDSNVETDAKVVDTKSAGKNLAVDLTDTGKANEGVTDAINSTVDAGQTTTAKTINKVGKHVTDVTTDDKTEQVTNMKPDGNARKAPVIDLTPDNDVRSTNKTVDAGTTTTSSRVTAQGTRVQNVSVDDQTKQTTNVSGAKGVNRQHVDEAVQSSIADAQTDRNRTVDASGTARGKMTARGTRRRVIDLSDETTMGGQAEVNRVKPTDFTQTVDESQFVDKDVATDVEVNEDESKPSLGKRLFGRKRK